MGGWGGDEECWVLEIVGLFGHTHVGSHLLVSASVATMSF